MGIKQNSRKTESFQPNKRHNKDPIFKKQVFTMIGGLTETIQEILPRWICWTLRKLRLSSEKESLVSYWGGKLRLKSPMLLRNPLTLEIDSADNFLEMTVFLFSVRVGAERFSPIFLKFPVLLSGTSSYKYSAWSNLVAYNHRYQ